MARQSTLGVFARRVERSLRAAMLKIGFWISRPLLRSDNADGLTDDDYQEAETYRDKNAVELTLVYQKRQIDKTRDERRQALAATFALLSILFAVLYAFAMWGWIAADR